MRDSPGGGRLKIQPLVPAGTKPAADRLGSSTQGGASLRGRKQHRIRSGVVREE